jgi:hypothetical protein
MNNNYKTIKKPTRTQNIWLNTTDALVDSERKIFTFNDLPLIQVRNHSVLKINSVTLSGAGVSSASAHNWTIKLNNVKYNTSAYFSSDNNSDPTIAMINYDTNNSIQTGSFALELETSDIKQLVIKVKSDDGHGLAKNSQNIDMHIGLTICEYDE